MVGAERRVAAPHPGPLLKREYVDMLGLDVATFAAQLGMDASLLGAMLEGRASIDVVTAVRIARALQLPAERIMQMQLRHEFYSIRQSDAFQGADLVRPAAPVPFPDQHLCGHLGRSRDAAVRSFGLARSCTISMAICCSRTFRGRRGTGGSPKPIGPI
jgi:addiction module HigA family antidote